VEYTLDSNRGCAFTPERGTFVAGAGEISGALGVTPTAGDGWQITTEWKLRGENGCAVSLHDWRATDMFDPKLPGVMGLRLMEKHEWTIGGDHRLDVEDFKSWLSAKIVEYRHACMCEEKVLNEKG